MSTVKAFVTDVWDRSVNKIRRADPLLMGAAIAYNALFALVPLAIVFVSMLSFLDHDGSALHGMITRAEQNLPPELARFVTNILQDSHDWAQSGGSAVIVFSTLVALWSGSRAVYAVQKALRSVEGETDDRGYIVSRLLGIGVTVAAGVGVLVAYIFLVVGDAIWEKTSSLIGASSTLVVEAMVVGVAIMWVWALLWAIYQWGPPTPLARSGIVSGLVAALVVIGSMAAMALAPSTSSILSIFGTAGVVLVWLYYVGIVVVAAPTLLNAIAGAIRDLRSR